MIIGIGGASRSGKTTLAKHLAEQLPSEDCLIIKQDNYTFPNHLMPKVDDEIDWEHPDGIDFDRLIEDVKKLTAEFVIIDGFLSFYKNKLFQLLDFSIFIEIDKKEFFERKKHDKRWGDVSEQYMQHIWKSYQKFGKINADQADLIFVNNDTPSMIETTLSELEQRNIL